MLAGERRNTWRPRKNGATGACMRGSSPRRPPSGHIINVAFEELQKVGVVGLVHVIAVPKTGRSDAGSVAIAAEPIARCGINWGALVVAQQGNTISLNQAAMTGGARRVVDCDP